MRIDAHQHFWKFDPVRDRWITDDMAVIRRDFLPGDLKPLLEQNNIDGCVAVQAGQSETETDFLIQLAEENDFIKAVVGWVDLQATAIKERLEHYKQFNRVKGFRHILQGEKDRALMLSPAFKNGISALQQYGFAYDILVFPDQLKFVREFVAAFPHQKFVIDHIAKPNIKEQRIEDWEKNIAALAPYQNLCCKISGLVTEADWKKWKQQDFKNYLDIVVETFGTDRILFGSDWPVCLLAASYGQTLDIVKGYFSSFTKNEQDKFFGENAIQFYNLS
jgi:L-fuconolactonase